VSNSVGTDLVVRNIDKARLALYEAKTMQEAKQIMDMAGAAEVYAKRQGLSQEAIDYAHSIKIEALRRLGEMLDQTPDAKSGPKRQLGSRPEPNSVPTNAELGISKKTSSIAQKLASLPQKQFEQVRAGTETITKAIREVEHAKRPKVRPPTGKYRVIYADPPWDYGNSGLQSYGHASHHYPSMTIEELCALPIADIAEKDAVLFLWVTSPLLYEAAPVITAWGFTYKTSFVWDKVKHNFGHYNSVRHELLLVCTRGSCTPDVKELHDSVQTIERSEKHSEKPEEFRTIIDGLYTSGARIELFARGTHPGWEGWKKWGNE
jgi:N6-adenosine-specific RNA methylase IME4